MSGPFPKSEPVVHIPLTLDQAKALQYLAAAWVWRENAPVITAQEIAALRDKSSLAIMLAIIQLNRLGGA